MITLRDYQQACVDAHFSYFDNASGNPLFVLPTAAGKSHIIAAFLNKIFALWPDHRVLVVTHVKELIRQNYDRFLDHWPTAPVGIYSAGLGRRDEDVDILFAGIQSIAHRREEVGTFDLILVDEAHLLPKKGEGRYRKYLNWMREQNPDVKVLGYTATPFRLDGGWLYEGEGRIFTDIAYEVKVDTLIAAGWLSPIRAKDPESAIDTTGVHTRKGDFVEAELEERAMEGNLVIRTVEDMIRTARAEDRKYWLVFACTVAHAESLREALCERGVDARSIYGTTPKDERDATIEAFRRGEIECLVNCQVLTTGFDVPRIDLLAMVRPTQSTGLYVQMAGRSMRLSPETGKTNALLLDYGGNVSRHGPLNDIQPRQVGDDGVAPTKTCPQCREVVPTGTMTCPDCGHEWERIERVVTHDTKASAVDPLGARQPKWFDVTQVDYRRHRKFDRPDSMRVDYWCGITRISEWVCFEHGGYATTKAVRWWTRRAGADAPLTVTEALRRVQELSKPTRVKIRHGEKYQEITDHDFARKETHDDNKGLDGQGPDSGRCATVFDSGTASAGDKCGE